MSIREALRDSIAFSLIPVSLAITVYTTIKLVEIDRQSPRITRNYDPPAQPVQTLQFSSSCVIYPPDNLDDVPTTYGGGEVLDPITLGTNQTVGYPITITFSRDQRVELRSAELLDGHGKDVEIWLSSPNRMPTENHQVNEYNLISIFAKRPLKKLTKYSVEVAATVNGAKWEKTWSFTTGTSSTGHVLTRIAMDKDKDSALAQAIIDRLNIYRRQASLDDVEERKILSRGCRRHANYLALSYQHESIRGPGVYEERRDLPGFTEEGLFAGRNSVIELLCERPLDSVDDLINTRFNRAALLDPQAKRVGVGCSQIDSGFWICVIDIYGDRLLRSGSYHP
jgi:hypothetical protein